MTSLNYDRLIKRVFALLGATGLAAFSGLPVLAQTNSFEPSQRSIDCSAYVNGGMGGPIANGSSAANSMMRQSSYDTATIPQNRSSDSMNQSSNSDGMRVDDQFSARNPNAAIPFRTNGPAGTSGGESNLNLWANSVNHRSFMQSALPSGNLTSRAYSTPNQTNYSNQSAATAPLECLQGGVNNR